MSSRKVNFLNDPDLYKGLGSIRKLFIRDSEILSTGYGQTNIKPKYFLRVCDT